MLMDLVIETLTGVSFELQVSPAETVMSVKSKIQRAEGIPVAQQHLIWQNAELDDHRRLRDYSIAGGSTIRLVLGMRGGPLNAHRVPPLRLAPIHLPPSASSILPKFTRFPPAHRRIIQVTRSTLPALTSLRPLTKTSDKTCLGASADFNDEIAAEAREDINSSDLPADSEVQNIRPKTGTVKQFSPNSHARLSPKLLSSEPQDLICARPIHSTGVYADDKGCQPIAPTSSSSTVLSELPSNIENSYSTPTAPSQTTSLVIPSIFENVSQGPGDEHCTGSLSPPPGYPPLLPSRALRHSFNSLEMPPRWRLYEHQRLSALSRSFLLRSPFTLCGSVEQDSDNSPPGTASGRDCQPEGATTLELSGEEYTLPSKTSSAAATLLAGILSSASDCFGPSCQTSGTERLDEPHYPFHWLRRTPCQAEESLLRQPFVGSAAFWDSDDTDEADAISTNLFELERYNEGPDDDDDDDSDETKGAYSCSLDDDDSLADLEDYLLYYRTGDLLFGPPSLTAACPSYSSFPLRDFCPPDLEADFGIYSTKAVSDASVKHHDSAPWHQEYSQLSEKVNDLKKRMRELRVRRQRRQKSKSIGHEVEGDQEEKPQADAISGAPSTPCDVSANILYGDTTSTTEIPVTSDTTSSVLKQDTCVNRLQVISDCSNRRSSKVEPSNRRRERRFATVTPPELSVLMQSAKADTRITQAFPHSSKTAPASKSHEIIRASMPSIPESLITQHRLRRPLSSFTLSSLSSGLLTAAHQSNSTPEIGASGPASYHSSHLLSNPALGSTRPHTSAIPIGSIVHPHSTLKGLSRLSPNSVQRHANHPSAPANTSDLFGGTHSPNGLAMPRNPPHRNDKLHTPLSPQKPVSPSKPGRRKRCSLCLRKTGLVGGYLCRCGRSFCSRHRYAELHSCSFDYKAEARRTFIASNPVVTAPKLPKI